MKYTNNKKGFTLVELLVVIAILAILATVSIVGYSSFTKNAKMSNDQTLVTEWNRQLQGQEALDEKFTTSSQARSLFMDNGSTLKDFTPQSSGYHFHYSKDNNRIYLISDDNNKSVYPTDTSVSNAIEPLNANYLTFTAEEANSTVTPNFLSGSWEYSKDGKTWVKGTNYTYTFYDSDSEYYEGYSTIDTSDKKTEIVLKDVGDKVMVRGVNCITYYDSYIDEDEGKLFETSSHFTMSGKIAASGSVTSLIDKFGIDSNITLPTIEIVDPCWPDDDEKITIGCFEQMFSNCASLTEAPELPSLKLETNCYSSMFSGCTSLTEAPELPATSLVDYCYSEMFYGCTSLTQAPELPSKSLANGCYALMFSSCTSLTKAPELPSKSLANGCYAFMFYSCTSLTEVPELPALTLAKGCYSHMFSYCTTLKQTPELIATTLKEDCYFGMFSSCTSLTDAPKLPALTLSEGCYASMFFGCTSLTEAPDLPASILAVQCYKQMFEGCASLIRAPKLPIITLETECYYGMFKGCVSLTQAPELPATILALNCYRYMFEGCISLKIQKGGTAPSNGGIIFICPTVTYEVINMFKDTNGTFKGSPTSGNTYYWYTE